VDGAAMIRARNLRSLAISILHLLPELNTFARVHLTCVAIAYMLPMVAAENARNAATTVRRASSDDLGVVGR
jgi:hypothetical protein